MSKMTDSHLRRTRRALLEFYDGHRRALPWREDPRPYRVWISEVMLQQTRVEAVVPYYRAWMERFPDVHALAAAPLDDVLKSWEGLGYYARARNLHRAARMVRDRMGGELPADEAALRALPGFGAYTAGAVASIAFGARVPAVDGNVRRVLARLYDEAAPAARWLRERAAALVDPERPGDFNQALMDLGATVCAAAPRTPRCAACPLRAECRAHARGTVAERPRARARKPVPEVEIAVAALVRRDARGRRVLLVVRRPGDGLLGGLWELPGAETAGEDPRTVAERVAAERGVRVAAAEPRALVPVTQIYSHFRGVYRAFLWEVGSAGAAAGDPAEWAGETRIRELALSRAHRRLAALACAPEPAETVVFAGRPR